MSRGCELRRISREDANLFLRYPEKLLELEIGRYETYKGRNYTQEVIDPARQFYDWHVLMALVSGSVAWKLLVKSGHQVGKSEQMWPILDGDARVSGVEQVQELNIALEELLSEEDEQVLIDLAMAEQPDNLFYTQRTVAARPDEWTVGDAEPEEYWLELQKRWERTETEINLELYWIKQQVQQFIQKAVEAESALLIVA